MTLETRTLPRPVEVRAATEGTLRTAVGYAAVFNSTVDIGGMWMETISPGAFTDALGQDVRALINHEPGRLLGRTAAGTLRLSQDAVGLAVEIDLPDTTDGRDVTSWLQRGDVDGMSFGFRVTKETWDETGDIARRTILAVDLREVSIVTFPAYGDTSIALRSLDAIRAERRSKNFNAAATRLRMKANLDFRVRSKA